MSRPTMKNDIEKQCDPLSLDDLKQVPFITEHISKIDRLEAEAWAMRDVKFLIFDDTDSQTSESESDNGAKGGLQFAIAEESANQESIHSGSSDSKDKGKGVASKLLTGSGNEPEEIQEIQYDSSDEEAMLQLGLHMSMEEKIEGQIPVNTGKQDPEDKGKALGSLAPGLRVICDNCQKDCPDTHYHCPTCNYGSFDLCPECVDSGVPCLNAKHQLIKRSHAEVTLNCKICSSCPEFPHNRKTRKFRLFRPREEFRGLLDRGMPNPLDICPHYVAVSYCWRQGQKRTCKVRDLDGKVRDARADDDVLDRAVDVANTLGLRMIWIDQECLPQPTEDSPQQDKDEQRIGVQAMDIIYNRACATAGLQESVVTLPQLRSLELFGARETNRPINFPSGLQLSLFRKQYFSHLLDFFRSTASDRWYTRAWVVQESLSSGDSLLLVFRRGEGTIDRFSNLRMQLDTGRPKHSLDDSGRDFRPEVICISVTSFRTVVQQAKLFLEQHRFTLLECGLEVSQFGSEGAVQIVLAAESLHPVRQRPKHHTSQVHMLGGPLYYGVRDTVDAAGALSLLKTRGCRYAHDLVAIMANMCGYEIRLDHNEVGAHCNSVRIALLTLALLNGDLSLLVPEVYEHPELGSFAPSWIATITREDTLTWLQPFDSKTEHASFIRVRGYNCPIVRTSMHGASPEKRQLAAYLWNVEGQIDLTPIKIKWKDTWSRMACLVVQILRAKEETEEEAQARMEAVNGHFSAHPQLLSMAIKELVDTGAVHNDSPVWQGFTQRRDGIRLDPHVDVERVDSSPQYQAWLAGIIFDILRFLYFQADDQPLTQAVANSIWQSVRTDTVGEDSTDLPDLVDESLFRHPDVVERPFKTLQLDKAPGREYRQVWLINRVMSSGKIWIGRYVPGPGRIFQSMSRLANHMRPPGSGISDEGRAYQNIEKESLIIRQRARQMIMDTQHVGQLAVFLDDNTKHPQSGRVTPGHIQLILEMMAHNTYTAEAERRRSRGLVAAFDVDGPCLVATPFSSDWEILPRPEIRSMRVCWVVEDATSRLPQGDTVTQKSKIGRSGPGSSRPYRSGEQPAMGTPLNEGHGAASEELIEEPDHGEDQSSGPYAGSYRVLNKVRGMWQIMDVPLQCYVFT